MNHAKKHIAVLLQGYTRGKSGGDIACIRIMSKLPKNKYIIHVFTSRAGKQLCVSEGLRNATYFVTSEEKTISHIVATYIERIRTFRSMNHEAYDTVYVSSDSLPDVLCAYILRKKYPEIRWVQKIYHPVPMRRCIAWILQQGMWRIIRTGADTIITSSHYLQSILVQKGFSSSKVVTNYLGVDHPALYNNRKKQSRQIVFIGRLHPSKGIFDLISAWKIVNKEIRDAHLTIIGSGSAHMVHVIKKTITKYRLGSAITLAGYRSDRETWSTAQKSAALVLPSYEEGFSLTIATACAYHIPVIAYYLPIYQELFPKQIIPVQKGDHIALGNGMIKTLRKKMVQKKGMFRSPYRWTKSAHVEKKYL